MYADGEVKPVIAGAGSFFWEFFLMDWWQHIPEHINPNLADFGWFHIRYYGLMYLVAFGITYQLLLYRLKTEEYEYSKELIQNFFLYAILGVIVGGRLGYVLFYDPGFFLEHPLSIINPFDLSDGFRFVGLLGMSYHGGLLGVVLGASLFCYKNKVNFWRFADLLSPAIPLGYTFGRIGNFLNGELYGRVTSVTWGMYFPLDPEGQLRHPSQLYEAFFEGLFLFFVLWSLRKSRPFSGFHFGLYLVAYGTVRFFIEYTREPNEGLGAVLQYFSMGQVLCAAMVLFGTIIMTVNYRLSSARQERV